MSSATESAGRTHSVLDVEVLEAAHRMERLTLSTETRGTPARNTCNTGWKIAVPAAVDGLFRVLSLVYFIELTSKEGADGIASADDGV